MLPNTTLNQAGVASSASYRINVSFSPYTSSENSILTSSSYQAVFTSSDSVLGKNAESTSYKITSPSAQIGTQILTNGGN